MRLLRRLWHVETALLILMRVAIYVADLTGLLQAVRSVGSALDGGCHGWAAGTFQ